MARPLTDRSTCNTSMWNPIILLKNLNTANSDVGMRVAIGLAARQMLRQAMIPMNLRDSPVNGYFVSIRNINAGGQRELGCDCCCADDTVAVRHTCIELDLEQRSLPPT